MFFWRKLEQLVESAEMRVGRYQSIYSDLITWKCVPSYFALVTWLESSSTRNNNTGFKGGFMEMGDMEEHSLYEWMDEMPG